MRRPDLAPADLPAIPVRHRPRLQHRCIRARAGLGHAKAHHLLAGHHPRQDLRPRFLGHGGKHRARPKSPMRNHKIAQPVVWPAQAIDVLNQRVIRDHPQVCAAQRGRHRDIKEPSLGRRHPHRPDMLNHRILQPPIQTEGVARIVEQIVVLLMPANHFGLAKGLNRIGDRHQLFGQYCGDGGHGLGPV
jgi:hypothetical protein